MTAAATDATIKTEKKLLDKALKGKSIPVPVHLFAITGRLEAAYFLKQVIYWSGLSTDPEGWFYMTPEDWYLDIGLGSDAIRSILEGSKKHKGLEKHLKFIETTVRKVRKGKWIDGQYEIEYVSIAPKKHYRANIEAIEAALKDYFEAVPGDDAKFDYMGDFGNFRKSKISKVQDFRKLRKTRTSGNSKSPLNTENSAKSKKAENSESPPPTPATQPEPSEPDGANGGGGEKSLTPIEFLLAENGINPHSWHFAADWTLEQLQVIVDRAKEPGINNPPAWIVSQLQMPSARVMAQREIDTGKDASPAQELTGQEATGFEAPVIPPFEPIIRNWKKDTPAPETWRCGVLPALQIQIHRATFNSWIVGSQVVAYEGDQELPTLTIVAPTDSATPWLESRLIDAVRGIAAQQFGNIALRIIAPADLESTLAAIRRNVEQPAHEPGNIFMRGVGWIQGHEGTEQQIEPEEVPDPLPPSPAQESKPAYQRPDPATQPPDEIWDRIKAGLKQKDLSQNLFDAYVKPSRLIGYDGQEIYVEVSSSARRELTTKLKDKLNSRIKRVTDGYWKIHLITNSERDRLPESLIALQEAG